MPLADVAVPTVEYVFVKTGTSDPAAYPSVWTIVTGGT
jgi:hypothetical protein